MDQLSFRQNKPFQFLSLIRDQDVYYDATIVCDGKYFKVHRMIISAYSMFLKQLFDMESVGIQHMLVHPVIVLPGVRKNHFEALLDYVYTGQVDVARSDLQMFIETAKYLEINGLDDIDNSFNNTSSDYNTCEGISTIRRELTQEISTNNGTLHTNSGSVYHSEEVYMPAEQIDTYDIEADFLSVKDEPIEDGTSLVEENGIDLTSGMQDNCENLNFVPKKRKLDDLDDIQENHLNSHEGLVNEDVDIKAIGDRNPTEPNRRNHETVVTKYKAILEVEKGIQKKLVAEKFGVKSNTLSTWLRNKDIIKARCNNGTVDIKTKIMKVGQFVETEQAVLQWLVEARSANIALTGLQIQTKAEAVAKRLGEHKFTASNGWLDRFKKRHGIKLNMISGIAKVAS